MSAGLDGRTGNGILLAGRLLLAGCFLPSAIARLTNVSGFAAALTLKGIPYGELIATAVTVGELVAPLTLLLGLAPRLSASVLIATTVASTAALHRFWEYGGVTRYAEQTIFMAQLGVVAALLFAIAIGPGAWSWQAWWSGIGAAKRKPAAKKKRSSPQARRPRPAPQRAPADDDEMADAA